MDNQKRVDKVQSWITKGYSAEEACKKVGCSTASYYYSRSAIKSKPSHSLVRYEVPDESDDDISIVIMKGKSSAIQGISASLAKVLGGGQ